jgi:cob(I)alamin adenosyltransferase
MREFEGKRLRMLEPRRPTGLVVVLTGAGKGKSTSAFGMVLRAVGHGLRACIVYFMKGDIFSGEMEALKRFHPQVELHLMGKGFCGIGGNPYRYEEHRADAQRALALAREKLTSGQYHLVVLDEIINALGLGLLELSQVLELLELRPPKVHVVLTGRGAPEELLQRAHTATEMRDIKHAFRAGIEPQKGIDY